MDGIVARRVRWREYVFVRDLVTIGRQVRRWLWHASGSGMGSVHKIRHANFALFCPPPSPRHAYLRRLPLVMRTRDKPYLLWPAAGDYLQSCFKVDREKRGTQAGRERACMYKELIK